MHFLNLRSRPFQTPLSRPWPFAYLHAASLRPIEKRRILPSPNASSSEVSPSDETSKQLESTAFESLDIPADFSLIESRQSGNDFANLEKEEIKTQIEYRRTKVFRLLEEVRRLRIQLQLRSRANGGASDEDVEYQSVVPIFNRSHFLQDKNMKQYVAIYLWAVFFVIVFGGLIAPSLEVRMGLGGTSYLEFIQSINLPEQLAEVDPIVASFCGGAVGALSTLLVVDLNNVKSQQRNR